MQIEKLGRENNNLRIAVKRSEHKLDKILSILENKLGPHDFNNNTEEMNIQEFIPDFKTLKTRLDVKCFFNFAHTYLTNECQRSYNDYKKDQNFLVLQNK